MHYYIFYVKCVKKNVLKSKFDDVYLMSMFGEGLCTGHHESGSFLQLPQPLTSLVQSDAGPCQLTHCSAGCHLHTFHPSLPGDVLGETTRSLPGRRLTNCRQVVYLKKKRLRIDTYEKTLCILHHRFTCNSIIYMKQRKTHRALLCRRYLHFLQRSPLESPCSALLASRLG